MLSDRHHYRPYIADIMDRSESRLYSMDTSQTGPNISASEYQERQRMNTNVSFVEQMEKQNLSRLVHYDVRVSRENVHCSNCDKMRPL